MIIIIHVLYGAHIYLDIDAQSAYIIISPALAPAT